jgi:hypothetical protein
MSISYDIKIVPVKPNETVLIQAAGKFVKILRVSPDPYLVTIQTDHGAKFNMVPGQGLPVQFNTLRVSHANAAQTLTITIYVGDIPVSDVASIQPGSTLFTVDWFRLAQFGAIQLLGALTLNGTNYRRKNIELINMTGGPSGNAAVNGIVSSPWTAKTASNVGAFASTWIGQERILYPSDAARNYPMFIETDDAINVTTFQLTFPLDISVVQTWLPIIS